MVEIVGELLLEVLDANASHFVHFLGFLFEHAALRALRFSGLPFEIEFELLAVQTFHLKLIEEILVDLLLQLFRYGQVQHYIVVVDLYVVRSVESNCLHSLSKDVGLIE